MGYTRGAALQILGRREVKAVLQDLARQGVALTPRVPMDGLPGLYLGDTRVPSA